MVTNKKKMKTKEEIIQKMADEMPWKLNPCIVPYIKEAMDVNARLQIEKDRERVKDAFDLTTDDDKIDSVPIILT